MKLKAIDFTGLFQVAGAIISHIKADDRETTHRRHDPLKIPSKKCFFHWQSDPYFNYFRVDRLRMFPFESITPMVVPFTASKAAVVALLSAPAI